MINFFKKIFQYNESKLIPPCGPPIKPPPANEAGFDGIISIDICFGDPRNLRFRRGSKVDFKENINTIPKNELVWITDIQHLFYYNREGKLFRLNFEEVNVDEL